ncbi:uncharacterized protein EV422DRAFT_424495 [Fimicolochytrium jonesii]|uniref:uncharacterized protein n=1 Tax=Fimicolochytrium jonesii TaxID=1396493 RepID=UPI0022FEE97D|nr:uncharacterized protein EV422DRAFT_424495 [Fimicolochytrium jonesii]KAI8821628.1 hypothetical protein EV422DRAFT_424495 [Fimicolochytrium jonesii]
MVAHLREALRRNLCTAGLSLSEAFSAQRYNSDPLCTRFSPLPTFPNRKSTAAFIIFSTKAMWEPFKNYLAEDPVNRLEGTANPIDDYARTKIADALREALPADVAYEIRYPYEEGERFVYFQRMAHLAGLAYFDPNWQFLCVHPVHGPWLAFRAVVLVDLDGPDPTVSVEEVKNPCGGVVDHARALYEQLQEEAASDPHDLATAYHKRWRMLVQIRDELASFLGERAVRERYSDTQVTYHYLKDRQILRDALNRR